MILEVTTAVGCPVACGYCPQRSLIGAYVGPRLLTLEVFESAIRNVPDSAEIHLSGFCEPFANNKAALFIERLGGRDWKLFTTGVGMTEDDAALVVANKPSEVVVHWQARLPVNLSAIDRLIAGCNNLRMVVEQGGGAPTRWKVRSDCLVPHSRAGNARPSSVRKSGPIRCGPAPRLDHPAMLPDGRLALCCQDYGLEHVLGNIAESEWHVIAGGEPMEKLRHEMISGDCLCRHCEFAISCGS